jgi:hypothetical protein
MRLVDLLHAIHKFIDDNGELIGSVGDLRRHLAATFGLTEKSLLQWHHVIVAVLQLASASDQMEAVLCAQQLSLCRSPYVLVVGWGGVMLCGVV